MPETAQGLILASASVARRNMLQSAGLSFRVVPSTVDEDQIRRDLLARRPDAPPSLIAETLAQAKAEQVSAAHADALVIGADQTLEIGGRLVTKAPDAETARRLLLELRGREHQLHSAVALAQHGDADFTICDTATLRVREFSDTFLDRYIADAGDSVLSSVGAYELEGLGVQLFEATDGDFFTILGLPLLHLLRELRGRGVLPA